MPKRKKPYTVRITFTEAEGQDALENYCNDDADDREAAIAEAYISQAKPFLRTLKRIPRLVRLAMATRVIEPMRPTTCLCGWAMREMLASGLATKLPTPDAFVDPDAKEYEMHEFAKVFGGTEAEWNNIFVGITERHIVPHIEAAFFDAVFTTR